MTSRPFSDFPRNEQGLVANFIGTAYDVVKRVSENLDELHRLDEVLDQIPGLAESSANTAVNAAMVPVRTELAEAISEANAQVGLAAAQVELATQQAAISTQKAVDAAASALAASESVIGAGDIADARIQVLRDDLSEPAGSSAIGFAGVSLVNTQPNTVQKVLASLATSIWEYSSLVVDKPTLIDPNTWDWTPAFVAALAKGGEILVPGPQKYIITTAPVLNSTILHCQPGVIFQRKANTDGAGRSYWLAGAAMFEVAAPGLMFYVRGQFTYDGNQQNQIDMEPTGFFLKTFPPDVLSTLPTIVKLENGTFINGTSGYLLFRGDDFQRRFETLVFFSDCSFNATRYGKGPGDPSTQTPLGYSPNYVMAMDYVRLTIHNFRAVWDAPITTGKYAAVALLGTYYGQSFANSGQCIITMTGHTYVRGMGRGGPGYDGSWATTNNGIGAIDVYGNGESLYIENIKAENCLSIPIRAKCSLKNYTVEKAHFVNCIGGMNVSPSSTGPAACTISVGQVRAENCTIPVLEFTGTNNSTNRIPSVNIESFYGTDNRPQENPSPAAILAPLRLRNITKAKVNSAQINVSNEYCVSVIDVENLEIGSVRGRSITGLIGLHIQDCKDITVLGFDMDTVSGPGVTITGATGKVTLKNGRVNLSADYGIFVNSPAAANLLIDDCIVTNVSGLSRGYYSAVPDSKLTNNIAGTGVTNWLVTTTTVRAVAQDNSWQPSVFFGGAAAPTSGTYRRGDVSLNQFALGTAGTPRLFTCTVAGSPGTWVVTNF